MDTVITKPEQITPEWLTGVLRKNGFLECGEVIGVKNKLTKTLKVSVVSRLEVDYSTDAPASAPSRLFLKVSRPNLSQAISSELNRKEVEFYRTIAPAMSNPPFIRCYDAAYSSEYDRSHLLLEDLSETHFQPESPQLPSNLYCESAVDCLAQLHAHWWEHPQLGKEIGDLFDENALNAFVGNVEENVISFLDFLGDRLSTEQRKIYDRLLASKYEIWGRLTETAGLTVTHGDAHWWNFLYPREFDKHRVRIFDWQLWHFDVGARDLAFLIALGGYAERRAVTEKNLLRQYYDSLIKHGVRNYTWDDCWNDYRWSAVRNLNIPVIQWSEGKSPEQWQDSLERAILSCQDLGCAELLGS